MKHRLNQIAQAIRQSFARVLRGASHRAPQNAEAGSASPAPARRAMQIPWRQLVYTSLGVAALAGAGYGLYRHPPLQAVRAGEAGVRTNALTGTQTQWRDGTVLVLPLVHEFRRYRLGDQTVRGSRDADAFGRFQSTEGLTLGVELSLRFALNPADLARLGNRDEDVIAEEIARPALNSVAHKVMSRHTVREIFSSKRADIVQSIERELAPLLAADGITLRSVAMGEIQLPQDYKAGMEKLLAEELESEKMRYTLELKEKRVRETELEAEAQKVRREKAAEASAREQVIAARAQEEAMKHVLPFKQRQIEQRQLEAEAERLARVKSAEGSAQARRIEAAGEAESRQKLADAEAYRLDRVGRVSTEQMAREGAVISKHPLLIQKTLADKLSDKVSVIIAPPPTNGDFIGAALLGKTPAAAREEQVSQAPRAAKRGDTDTEAEAQ